MSQTGDRNIGGMVDPAMGAGGPAVPSEEDILIEVEGQAPGLVDETLQDMVVQMNEDGSAELVDPAQEGEEVLTEDSHTAT